MPAPPPRGQTPKHPPAPRPLLCHARSLGRLRGHGAGSKPPSQRSHCSTETLTRSSFSSHSFWHRHFSVFSRRKAHFCPHFSPSLSATQQGTGSARAAGTPQPLLSCHNGAHNPKQGLMVGISGTRVMNNPIKIGSTTSRNFSTPSPTARGQHPAPLLAGSSPLLPSMCSTRAGTLLLQSCSSAGWTLYCSTCSRRRAAAPRQSPA